ncbi:hypothetical protein CRUP_035878 [Coryphaenoides rupestris]|nr:hypothetical protein CRUP_035878 [Coryphaenoides rupestris]
MHPSGPRSSEVRFLPPMDPLPGLGSPPDTVFDFGHPGSTSLVTGEGRRRTEAGREGVFGSTGEEVMMASRLPPSECVAKRRRLVEEGADLSESSSPTDALPAPPASPPLPHQEVAFPQTTASTSTTSTLPGRLEAEGSCMEVDAAQRRLREIEDRITLEDDDDDEDLDVEPFPRRPVLVINQSCMELVLWRPPDDALSRRLKDSLQRQQQQRKQQTASRPPPTPTPCCLSSTHQSAPAAEAPYPRPYSFPEADTSGEEDMEL